MKRQPQRPTRQEIANFLRGFGGLLQNTDPAARRMGTAELLRRARRDVGQLDLWAQAKREGL